MSWNLEEDGEVRRGILKHTMCGKGPNMKWDGKLYHRADEALLRSLIVEI